MQNLRSQGTKIAFAFVAALVLAVPALANDSGYDFSIAHRYVVRGLPVPEVGSCRIMMMDLKSVLPVLMPALVILLWYLRTRLQFSAGKLVAVVGFAVYLLLVSKYTIFPLRFDSEYIDTFRRQTKLLDGVNLVPFKDLPPSYLVSIQGWGNLVLGVPWGFVLPFVASVSGWRSVALSGVVFAVTIELIQLIISLLYGFAYRVIDINDVLLNFVGVLIGYGLLNGVALLYRTAVGTLVREGAPRNGGLWNHFESVLLEMGRR